MKKLLHLLYVFRVIIVLSYLKRYLRYYQQNIKFLGVSGNEGLLMLHDRNYDKDSSHSFLIPSSKLKRKFM